MMKGPPLWTLNNKYQVPILEYETIKPNSDVSSYTGGGSSGGANDNGDSDGEVSVVRSILVLAPPKPILATGFDGPLLLNFPSSHVLILLLSDFFSSEKTRTLLHALWLTLLADQDFKQVNLLWLT